MILPIITYPNEALRKPTEPVTFPLSAEIKKLTKDMIDTVRKADGIGLAAPQVGKAINLFIIDTKAFEDETVPATKKVFINAEILDEWGEEWGFEEGCLSIPFIREEVFRWSHIHIKYQDENFKWHKEDFDGMAARVILHEFDHVKGKLFVDYLTPLKKRLLKNKLINISKGVADTDYKMRLPK